MKVRENFVSNFLDQGNMSVSVIFLPFVNIDVEVKRRTRSLQIAGQPSQRSRRVNVDLLP
jgi:hypothetical protein